MSAPLSVALLLSVCQPKSEPLSVHNEVSDLALRTFGSGVLGRRHAQTQGVAAGLQFGFEHVRPRDVQRLAPRGVSVKPLVR